VFGSFLKNKQPHDIDVLITYDSRICAPARAHSAVAEAVHKLGRDVFLPVHLTLLTLEEEQGTQFKRENGCISLEEAMVVRESLLKADDAESKRADQPKPV